ncbi:MAG: 50S ribosomal protein L5 [Proteobacteria bacterium]|jgi:large subunit ribosomal protein L5|nr:50S ribosomal protein L5 [Pseudomonadota bacterium]NLN61632.1 50S ribosomal protein L5 [Myxococcales bacterium]
MGEKVQLRFREKYKSEVRDSMKKKFSYKNEMQIPRLQKIVLNVGLGEAVQNTKILDSAVKEIETITGQKPIITRARKSIANFKLRDGMPIGCAVTLRREKMWEFLDRFITFALPRVRDFKGVSRKGFDGRGNYTLGVREQIIFPEIEYDKVEKVKGMNITFVTTAASDEEGMALLQELGVPFRK